MVARFFILVSRFVELCDKKLSCIVRRESNDSFKESSATLLIVIALVTYNISNLMLQKAFSESSALILFMTSYLVFNDDLLVLNFSSFNNSITNDYFAFFTKILICLFSAFYFLIVSNFLKEQKITSFEFFLIILLAILGILLMCSSNDFLTAYLAVELSSLAFYILASFRKSSSYSVESGIKYFVTGAVSSAFFLLGSSFIYGLTGSINFSDFHDLFECLSFYFYTDDSFYHYVSPEMDRYWSLVQLITLFSVNDSLDFSGLFDHSFVEFGLTLILFSLFIKLSLAPFHLWSLDVYEGAPTSSTVFFAVITKLRCEVTRVCSVQSRILFPLRFVVFAFMFSSDYVKRSNNMYSTVNRIGTISLTLFCGGSFLIKWLDYTLKSYLRLEILNNIKEDPLWKNISKISECSNSIRIPIYQLARSTARRFSINLKKASCETFKIGCNLKTIEKIIPFGLKATMMLKKSRGFSSRPNMKGTTSDEQIKFVHAIHKCWDKKCRKYKNLYQVIFAEETLQKAYKKISTRRIILTEVNAKEKMDSFDFGIFKNISSQLFKSCYKFSSFKSRVISYKNKTEECSFTVISFWDKVVVHAVYIVLKEVYDSWENVMFFKKYKNSKIVRKQCEAKSIFLNVSHGSRSGKSCHTALNDIRTWKSCTWFVKLDIDMFFGEVNQKRLLNILSESIDDELVMNLIQQMFNVFSNKSISSSEFFQDNLFSCFLCNVYLHKLDEFIIKKRHEIWDKNDIIKFAAPQTEEWKKAINIDVEELKSCKSFHQKRVLKRTLMNEKKKKARKMGLVRYTLADEQKAVVGAKVFDTIYYVRYLDEFLLGIKGLKSLAADIKKKISQYIKSDLQLALISSELYNVKSSKVRYLGFDISVLDVKNNRTLKLKKIIAFKKLRNKIKLKKKIVENRWEFFLKSLVQKKIIYRTNQILTGVTNKIKAVKVIDNIVVEEILTGLKTPTENFVSAHRNLNIQHNIKELAEKWKMETKIYLKENWLKNDELVDVIGGKELLNAHKHLLECMSKITNSKSSEVIVNRSSPKVKKYRTNPELQDYYPAIFVPQDNFISRMREWGMIDQKVNKPIANKYIFKYHDINIINYYKTKAAVVLEYYKPAANFYWLKKQVDYHMRYSLLFTLARKHRKSVSKIIGLIGKNASIFIQSTNGKLTKVSSFLVSSEIQNYKRGFTSIFDPMKGFKKLKKPFLKMSIPKVLYKECQAKNCTNNKIEIYYVKAIYHKILRNLKVFPIHFENKKLSGIKAFESYFGRKQIPLCKEHYIDIYSGRFVDLNVKNNLVPLKLWSQKKVEIKW